jgi:uncharacterized RmlC-like cupin family protein
MTEDRWHQPLVHVRGQELRADTGQTFVPPYVPHREENPGQEEAVVIIARSSQEGIVVNLDSLWPDDGGPAH